MTPESRIQSEIMLALSEAGCVVWRQNTGLAWVGQAFDLKQGGVMIQDPRRLHAGLCVGSSDIVGIAPGGKFLAVEVKTKTGRVTKEQQRFIDVVRQHGGIAGVARTPEEALSMLDT